MLTQDSLLFANEAWLGLCSIGVKFNRSKNVCHPDISDCQPRYLSNCFTDVLDLSFLMHHGVNRTFLLAFDWVDLNRVCHISGKIPDK